MTEFRMPKRDRSPGLVPSPQTEEPEYPTLTTLIVENAALRARVEKAEAALESECNWKPYYENELAPLFEAFEKYGAPNDIDTDLKDQVEWFINRFEKVNATLDKLTTWSNQLGHEISQDADIYIVGVDNGMSNAKKQVLHILTNEPPKSVDEKRENCHCVCGYKWVVPEVNDGALDCGHHWTDLDKCTRCGMSQQTHNEIIARRQEKK